jgi:hypothetical protein
MDRMSLASRTDLDAVEAHGVVKVGIYQRQGHRRRVRGQERLPVDQVRRGQQRIIRPLRAVDAQADLPVGKFNRTQYRTDERIDGDREIIRRTQIRRSVVGDLHAHQISRASLADQRPPGENAVGPTAVRC